MNSLNDYNIVFIIGCSRSGTSILGETLTSGERTELLFEFPFWNHLISPFRDHTLNSSDVNNEIIRKTKNKLFHMYHNKKDKTIIEKNSRNSLRITFLAELFPNAKFIHIVRDGRDVACSLVPGLQDEWRHLKPFNWERLVHINPIHLRGAMLWEQVLSILLTDLNKVKNDRILVKYEDFVRNTSAMAKTLCEFINIPFSHSMEEFCVKVQNKTDNSYHAARQVKWFRNNHSKRIQRWKKEISKKDMKIINKVLNPLLIKFGYK